MEEKKEQTHRGLSIQVGTIGKGKDAIKRIMVVKEPRGQRT